MTQSYICNTSKRIVGRSAFSLNAKKCPEFNVDDIIYLSNPEHVIHSRWVVTKVGDKLVEIEKSPEVSISVAQEEILSHLYTEKYSLLSETDAEKLDKHFLHQMKVFPSYDYESKNSETNRVLSKLKDLDLKIEAYVDSINNDDIINGRLEEPYSALIIEDYGVITFKCLEYDPLLGDENVRERFSKQLKCNDMRELLSKSPQITDESSNLTINHMNVVIYETDNREQMEKINETLEASGSSNRVFNSDGFIYFINRHLFGSKLISNVKRIGIIQSLLPKFINSKTVNIAKEPLKFIPSDTFELDDIQKETLRSLNGGQIRIRASAGSGKTILLLAKAYEVAVANPEKQFLLLCFNNKLAEDINNQAINTGRNVSNLRISTFDKFLQDENIPYKCDDPKEKWNARKKSFVELAMNDELKYSFGGVFVDEVQQMEDEWIYALLKCTDEEKYMVVSGDYYQSINPGLADSENEDDDFIEEGDTSEYKIGEYVFKTIVLDKNYRNTKAVARVLSKMVAWMHKTTLDLGIPEKEEKVLGHAYKESVAMPRYFKVKAGQEEVEIVKEKIDLLINQYDCAPGDILVVCPRCDRMTSRLVNELWKKYEICNFVGSGFSDKISKEGIKMGTIGRSIGLDFKAVIVYGVAGLEKFLKQPCDYIDDIEHLQLQSKNVKRGFLKTLRNLYVACSRARDILIVLDDSEQDNLFSKFLKESGLEES